MASIKQKNNKYYLIYYFDDLEGKRRQKWESFNTQSDAEKRLKEIEYEKVKGTFIPPTSQTVSDFMMEFVELYGTKNWSASTHSHNLALIKNYINPFIGHINMQSVSPLIIERYYNKLRSTDAVSTNKVIKKNNKVTSSTIRDVHKLLKTAFNNALLWNLIYSNPFLKIKPPQHEYNKREIWTSEQIAAALKACDDPKLSLAIQLSFACSLRIGEILGLTWDNVHITDEAIENDNAYIFIDKQLNEIHKASITDLEKKNIIKIFENGDDKATCVVLKSPKTKSSIRKIWLPKTLALLLQEWKTQQVTYKDYYGEKYQNNDLVITLEDGNPCREGVIRRNFNSLIQHTGLPKVVFHSLRHSSTTYKLKLNHGDIKATQGDTGHAQTDMITDVYSHILDEDRKQNAQKFNESFYETGLNIENHNKKIDVDKLVESLKENPELLSKLASLLNNDD